MNTYKLLGCSAVALVVTGCANSGIFQKNYPTYEPTPVAIERPAAEPVVVNPIKSAPKVVSKAPPKPVAPAPKASTESIRAEMLSQQVRANQPAKKQTLAAYKSLLSTAITQLREGNSRQAEATLLQAHSIERDDALLYLYLSEATLKNNKPAEAAQIARRGLLVARTKRVKVALWKMTFISAKTAGDAKLMEQALTNIKLLEQPTP